ncbi:MAG TPA: PmoA family protein [Bryobacteraceae bacterium]|nr:PmoA family protein [Bryobacteraceae bacterium]
MKHLWLAALLVLPVAGQTIDVNIDGKPFTTFYYGNDDNKPFLWPLRTADGKMITRRWPIEKDTAESHDHPHHRGLWFTYDDVNGVKFWENDPSSKNPHIGKLVVEKADWKDGNRKQKLAASINWIGPDGKTQLREERVMTFSGPGKMRIIDFDSTLTAVPDVVFGDTKEGAFAIRLADELTERKTGHMVNADGLEGEKQVWGKRSNWVDYSGEVDGEKVGVAIFDAATNPRHPTYWHSRAYGLFALNPFGQHAFDPSQPESQWKLDAGKSLHFRWRVVIHPGDTQSAHIADLYKEWK